MILPACGALRTVDRYGSYVIAASFWPATNACAAGPGSRLTTVTSLTDRPFFFRNHASVKYGAVPGAEALVHLEDLLRRDAVRIPDDPRFHRRRGALHIARSDREVPILLRNLLH